MSCQMIRAQDWDRMVESGRVGARAGVAVGTASRDVPPRPPSLQPSGPDPDGELLTLLSAVREAERQLQTLLARLQAELDRRRPDVSWATGRGSDAA